MTRRKGRTCEACGSKYDATYPAQRTCGRSCGASIKASHKHAASKVWIRPCIECSHLFVARRAHTTICGQECKRVRANRVATRCITDRYRIDSAFRERVLTAAHNRRAVKLGVGQAAVTITYLGERDNWTCGICHQHVTQEQASIDHIVPLSKGGTHDLTNVHVAHRSCNYAKGNRGSGEQLLLVG